MRKVGVENEPALVGPQLLLGAPDRIGGEEMIKVENIEAIRRAYFIEGMSIRAISRKLHHGRRFVKGDRRCRSLSIPFAEATCGPSIGAVQRPDRRAPGGKRATASQVPVIRAQAEIYRPADLSAYQG